VFLDLLHQMASSDVFSMPDGFFGSNHYKQFDGILAMYHDQGLIPFKFMAFQDGVNFTAGLPFVRTSPDHGTAYDIAGKNQADPQSMRNALFMAIDIWAKRNNFEGINKNPLPMTQFRREKFRIDF
jgi:4-hydroxythreonine-4-phosphate dehydrogenase